MSWWEILRVGLIVVGGILAFIGLRMRESAVPATGAEITSEDVAVASAKLSRVSLLTQSGMLLVGAGAVSSLLVQLDGDIWVFTLMAAALAVLVVTTIAITRSSQSFQLAQLTDHLDPRGQDDVAVVAERTARETRYGRRHAFYTRLILISAVGLIGLAFLEMILIVIRAAIGT